MGRPPSEVVLETPRLILRTWRDEDREALFAMADDPLVMRRLPAMPTRAEREAQFERILAHHARHGFGYFALETRRDPSFAGFVGLQVCLFEARFTPTVEIGWRLVSDLHGRGLATEAARACLGYGFEELGRGEIVSFTTPDNLASRRVMEKLGMRRDPGEDFDHPSLPDGHPLRRHVLYRLGREDFLRDP